MIRAKPEPGPSSYTGPSSRALPPRNHLSEAGRRRRYGRRIEPLPGESIEHLWQRYLEVRRAERIEEVRRRRLESSAARVLRASFGFARRRLEPINVGAGEPVYGPSGYDPKIHGELPF